MNTRTDERTGLVLRPVERGDPRLTLDDAALIEASRNAFPLVAQRKARSDSAGLAAGAVLALALGGLTFWSMSGHRAQPAASPTPVPVAKRALPQPAAPVPMAPPRTLVLPAPAPHAPTSFALPAPQPGPAAAPILVFDTGSAAPVAIPSPTATIRPPTAEARPPAPYSSGGENDQFANRVGQAGVEVASARRLSDPASTITQGTLIAAVLETAIDTDLPGYVRAVVSEDVRSFDGAHVLVPRSTRLIGQYKSGLQAGQTRAYVIWTRLIRPDGVSVALASPATDFAGRSGLDGKVDSHFMKRFSSAALLTVIGGLSAIGNSAVAISGGQNAASVAAQRDTSIPPTIKVPQGQPIRIFTARDLDFSTVQTAPTASE